MTDWSEVEIRDENPEKVQRAVDEQKGHDLVLVVRLNENGNPRKRSGYDETGRYTRVDNTTYKCRKCGVETGTSSIPSTECPK